MGIAADISWDIWGQHMTSTDVSTVPSTFSYINQRDKSAGWHQSKASSLAWAAFVYQKSFNIISIDGFLFQFYGDSAVLVRLHRTRCLESSEQIAFVQQCARNDLRCKIFIPVLCVLNLNCDLITVCWIWCGYVCLAPDISRNTYSHPEHIYEWCEFVFFLRIYV